MPGLGVPENAGARPPLVLDLGGKGLEKLCAEAEEGTLELNNPRGLEALERLPEVQKKRREAAEAMASKIRSGEDVEFPDSVADDPPLGDEPEPSPLEARAEAEGFVEVYDAGGNIVRRVDVKSRTFYRAFQAQKCRIAYRMQDDGNDRRVTITVGEDAPEPFLAHFHDAEAAARALKLCISSMVVGETTTFRVGDAFPGVASPEFQFSVTLVDVYAESTAFDGDVFKRRVKSTGGSGKAATDGCAVTVRFREVADAAVGGFDDDDERNTVPADEWMELDFELGDGTAMLGVEHAVKSMREGEIVRIRMRGESTLPDVPAELPPGTDLAYEELHVEVVLDKVGRDKVNKFSMKVRDKLRHAEDLRLRANALFKAGRLKRAVMVYERGIDLFNSLSAEGDKDKGTYEAEVADANRQCRKAQVAFYLNAALARVKLEEFSAARDDILEVFDLDDVTSVEERAKAHFRMGQAQAGLLDYGDAIKSFRTALELAPALVRADANRELNRVAELQAAQDAKDRAVVSAAFERSSAAADGDVFYSRAEKDAIVEPYRRGLARPPTKPVERIEDLAEAIAEVEEEDEEVARKRKEDFYNSQIRMGTMKVCVAPP